MEEQADERGKYCWETCSTSAITTSVSSTFFCTSAASFFRLSNWVMMLQEEWVHSVWWQTLLHLANIPEQTKNLKQKKSWTSQRNTIRSNPGFIFSVYYLSLMKECLWAEHLTICQREWKAIQVLRHSTHLHSTVYLTLPPNGWYSYRSSSRIRPLTSFRAWRRDCSRWRKRRWNSPKQEQKLNKVKQAVDIEGLQSGL